jgi:CubicO group peptidase (beta-lactamase class C family)
MPRNPPLRLATVGALTVLQLGCGGGPRTVSEGVVAPGFERVRAEFDRNLAERGERGAALAVYQRGQLVVDLWGGERGKDQGPWLRDTLVPVYSTTKGVAALLLAVAASRGWLRYEGRVAQYWPEFAQNGKAEITVRQLLSHEAGLVLLDEPVHYETVRDLDALATLLARQKPRWEPGTRHGYHLSTLGFYMNELFRRVEPRRRSMGQVLREDLATVLPGELYIGVPAAFDTGRVARVETTSPMGGLMHLTDPPFAILTRMLSPWSVMTQTFAIPKDYDVNDPRWWQVEMPSGNGIGTARGIAWMYGTFANGGGGFALQGDVLASLEAPATDPPHGPQDEVLGTDSHYGLGFIKPSSKLEFGGSQRAYGMPGAGGSFGFADPDHALGYAYVMNRMGYHMSDDPRELALRAAVYASLRAHPRDKGGLVGLVASSVESLGYAERE